MRNMPLEIFSEGDSFIIDLSFYEEDGTTPLNLTGAAIEWAICTTFADPPPPVFLAALANGIVLVGAPTLGTAKVEVHPNHVGRSAVLPGDYFHMARVVFPSGRTTEQLGGPLKITESPFY